MNDYQPVRASMPEPRHYEIGAKVSVKGFEGAGFGEIASYADDEGCVRVRYFTSPIAYCQRTVPLHALRRVELPEETRCYHHDQKTEAYRAGRILARFDDPAGWSYHVRFANQVISALRETEFHVRSYIQAADPIETLACLSNETPHFFEHRSEFMRQLATQRAACQGMETLLSSKIDPYPHQVEVVRRILQDPTKVRWLLGDEVGLGKTIEAGLVLRQLYLDHPTARIAVFVPSVLQVQWKDELARRFGLGHIEVCSHDDLASASDRPFDCVVIDEVHRIVGTPERYKAALTISEARHLLLLSATPVLHHEEDLLKILHLLDPENYSLDDLSGFRARLDLRKDLGRLLWQLTRATHAKAEKRAAQRLGVLLEQDPIVQRLCADLQQIEVEAQVHELANELRIHLSETYRIHRRMLRTRRSLLVEKGDINEHREEPDVVLTGSLDRCDMLERIWSVLDEWRTEVGAVVSAEHRSAAARTYQELGLAFDADMTRFLLLVEKRRKETVSHAESDLLAQLEALALAAAQPANDDRTGDLRDLLDQLACLDPANKYVVFCTSPSRVREIEGRLAPVLQDQLVAAYDGRPHEEQEQDLLKFRNCPECRFLLADSSIEEGRNLQFANGIVLFDQTLPMRGEQRLGRLDRIGRDRKIPVHVLLTIENEDLGLDMAWHTILTDGFGLYDGCLADLQFLVERQVERLRLVAFDGGPRALVREIESVRDAIANERDVLGEQDVIDGLHLGDIDESPLFQAVQRADRVSTDFGAALGNYLRENLLLRVTGPRNQIVVKLDEKSVGRGRNRSVHVVWPLLPYAMFSPIEAYLGQPGSAVRFDATRDLSLELFRPGHPFVTEVSRICNWDDRGRAYAVLRFVPNTDNPLFVFRFSLTTRAHLNLVDTHLSELDLDQFSRASLLRLLEGWFPTTWEEVFVDQEAQCPPDGLVDVCRQPYSRSDRNLGGHRARLLHDLLGEHNWPDLCRRVAAQVVARVSRSPEHKARRLRAIDCAHEHFTMTRARLSARRRAMQDDHGRLETEIAEETVLEAAVLEALANPEVHVDSIGFYVLSSNQCQWRQLDEDPVEESR